MYRRPSSDETFKARRTRNRDGVKSCYSQLKEGARKWFGSYCVSIFPEYPESKSYISFFAVFFYVLTLFTGCWWIAFLRNRLKARTMENKEHRRDAIFLLALRALYVSSKTDAIYRTSNCLGVYAFFLFCFIPLFTEAPSNSKTNVTFPQKKRFSRNLKNATASFVLYSRPLLPKE